MGSRSGRHLAIGVLSILYGLILCLFWGWLLWASGAKLPEEIWTVEETLTVFLFALIPVMLLVTGCLLCLSRAGGGGLRVGVTVITAILLGAKAVIAGHWALEALQFQMTFFLVGPQAIFWGLLVLVALPSGIWAFSWVLLSS